ncbi:ubiquinol-cytochrome C chaperone family protein [Neoaquamicrobium sediminum]|uniref:ubiquinol-cytochrome C chaperone family protein n=1 Tax=Neoaquamicrobium sediminum TaxID=1849104 RepID=UPI003BA94D87
MFKSILSLGRRPNQRITDALYGEIVASARQPTFYSEWGVSDTPLGRFEMLCVHMFLFLDRAKGSTTALADVAQDMTDEFFKDVEHSLRELGIGDLGVPKRMKKLAKMFYGRAEAYREALAAGDTPALTAALARNIGPERESWPEAAHIATYVERSSALLATQPDDELLAGRLVFPNAGEGAGKA